MAGVTLLAAFPIAYGILLPALYLPAIAMLLALGLRGVSFEFRYQTVASRKRWDAIFGFGSIVAAAMQGVILGALLQGINVSGEAFSGSVLDVVRPFPCLVGLVAINVYLVLGAAWLRLRHWGFESIRRAVAPHCPVCVCGAGDLYCHCLSACSTGGRSRLEDALGSDHPSWCLLFLGGCVAHVHGVKFVQSHTFPAGPFARGALFGLRRHHCLSGHRAVSADTLASGVHPPVAISSSLWGRCSSLPLFWATRRSPTAYSAVKRQRKDGTHEFGSATGCLVRRTILRFCRRAAIGDAPTPPIVTRHYLKGRPPWSTLAHPA